MSVHLSPKENLLRALRRADPEYVPVRRMDGRIPGMIRLHYRNSMLYQAGSTGGASGGRAGCPLASNGSRASRPMPLGTRWRIHRLWHLIRPDPNEPDMFGAMFDGIDREANLVLAEVPYLLFERAYLLMGMEAFFVAAAEQPAAGRGPPRAGRRLSDHAHSPSDRMWRGRHPGNRRLWRAAERAHVASHVARADRARAGAHHRQRPKRPGRCSSHSCGHIMELLPDLIEVGVDVLDPDPGRGQRPLPAQAPVR